MKPYELDQDGEVIRVPAQEATDAEPTLEITLTKNDAVFLAYVLARWLEVEGCDYTEQDRNSVSVWIKELNTFSERLDHD